MGISTRKIVAAGATALLVGASTILIAAPASAADYYVDQSELGTTEVSPYPAGWFRGNVTGTPGTYATTPSGLTVSGGDFQLLNGVEATWPEGSGLNLSDADFAAPGITDTAGAAWFQIPVFTSGGAAYTTLRADAAGIANDEWITSWAFGGFAAGDTASLEDFANAMGADYQVLAFGFFVDGSAPTSVVSIDWAGDTYWFLPAAPTATMTPSSATTTEFADTGVTGTFTGFVPGEVVDIGLGSGSSGGSVGTVTADSNGVATFTFTGTAANDYFVNATGLTSGVYTAAEFSVVAALPATGADAAGPLALGGTLLLAGLAFVVVMQVRRKRGATAA